MELDQLTRAQKEELYKLLKQRELKEQESVLATFAPHKGQEAFLKSPARIRAAFCGNGWGKTTALTIDLIYAHLRKHPYRNTDKVFHSWLLVPGLDKAQDYWTEIRRWCPPSQLPKPNKLGSANIRRFEWPNGSMTTIYSHDQESDKLEGTNIDALFCDEPPPRALWIAAFRGLRNNPNYYVVIAGTPLSAAWMYQDVYLPGVMKTDPNICVIQGSTYDNPNLSKDFIEDFASRLTEDEKRIRLYGEFASLQGRVFKEFNRQTHVIPVQTWPNDYPVWVGIDPHMKKKSTAVFCGMTPEDDLVVFHELAGNDIPDLAQKIKTYEASNKLWVVKRRIDNSGTVAGWDATSAIEILDDFGIRVSPMRNREKSVLDGITRMRDMMRLKTNKDGKKRPNFYVMDHCVHTITDLEMYGWDEGHNEAEKGVKEKPKKINDDFCDPIRYIIMSNPTYRVSTDAIIYTQGTPYGQPDVRAKIKNLKED